MNVLPARNVKDLELYGGHTDIKNILAIPGVTILTNLTHVTNVEERESLMNVTNAIKRGKTKRIVSINVGLTVNAGSRCARSVVVSIMQQLNSSFYNYMASSKLNIPDCYKYKFPEKYHGP